MKQKILIEIEFEDGGYKGHGDDIYELIEECVKREIEVGLEHDGVIKPDFKVTVISKS